MSNHVVSERLIREREVISLTGKSRSSIYRDEKSGKFPRRVRIGINSVAWKLTEIQDWISNRETVV